MLVSNWVLSWNHGTRRKLNNGAFIGISLWKDAHENTDVVHFQSCLHGFYR